MLLAFAVSQFLELQLISLMNGIYVFFIAAVITLPFVRLIQTSPPVQSAAATQPAEKDNEARPTLLAWVGIAANIIAYINIGASWNVERAEKLVSMATAAQVIAWCVLLSLSAASRRCGARI